MIAIITGDIINSRALDNQEKWLKPLKNLFKEYGLTPKNWEIYRGDSFQIELKKAEESLAVAIRIKAIIKSIEPTQHKKRNASIDVRMAIGIGEKDYDADRISESNGPAFVFSGEKFESLKKEKTNLAVKTNFKDFDEDVNMFLKLANLQMDNWTVSSGELMDLIFRYPSKNQKFIGEVLGIEQSSVSGRYKRACAEEIIDMERVFRKKLKEILK